MGNSIWRDGRVTDTFVIGEELLDQPAPEAGVEDVGADVEGSNAGRVESRLARLLGLARSGAKPAVGRKAIGALALGAVAGATAVAWPAGQGRSEDRLRSVTDQAPDVEIAEAIAPRDADSLPPAPAEMGRDPSARSPRRRRRGPDRAVAGSEPGRETEHRRHSPPAGELGTAPAPQTTSSPVPPQDPQVPQPAPSAPVASQIPPPPEEMSRRETLAREFGL